MRGAITQAGRQEELCWPVIGGWKVPVDEARATVDAGAAIQSVNCFTGPLTSTIGCTQYYMNHAHTQGVYAQQGMLPGEYLTVVAGFPPGTTGGEAIYERRHTIATAFSVNAVTGSVLVGLLILLVGGVIALYLLRGRDARVVGKKAAEGDHPPVSGTEFEPPDGVRPGQIGTLIDEQADVIDVTATIVDLAVRGYLLIEEEDKAVTGRLDWTLRRLDRPVVDLLPYERTLLDALLTAPDGSPRDAVRLSELGGTFATKLAQVRSAMYDDVVKQGWFARRPDTVRSRWTVAGIILTLVGIAGPSRWRSPPNGPRRLAVIIAGAALAYGGQYMPAKTARGSTVLAHTIGFRASERGVIPEGEEMASRQRIALFSRFLPYAVVFDTVPSGRRRSRTRANAPRARTTSTGTRARRVGPVAVRRVDARLHPRHLGLHLPVPRTVTSRPRPGAASASASTSASASPPAPGTEARGSSPCAGACRDRCASSSRAAST